jgi:hypothetical protein
VYQNVLILWKHYVIFSSMDGNEWRSWTSCSSPERIFVITFKDFYSLFVYNNFVDKSRTYKMFFARMDTWSDQHICSNWCFPSTVQRFNRGTNIKTTCYVVTIAGPFGKFTYDEIFHIWGIGTLHMHVKYISHVKYLT